MMEFSEAFQKWDEQVSKGEAAGDLETFLRREYRAAWAQADPETQGDVLSFLAKVLPSDGTDIVWAASDSVNGSVASLALFAALKYVRNGGAHLGAAEVAHLMRIVEGGRSDSIRYMAFHVLEAADPNGMDHWLRDRSANDSSDSIRLRANIILTRHGSRKAAEAVLADIRKNPGHFGVAMDLWDVRNKVELSEEEHRELRSVIARYVAWLHGNLRDRSEDLDRRIRSGRALARWRREGFPIEMDAVDTVYDLVTSESRKEHRMSYTDLLAAFDMPEARERIEEIARTDEAAEVREHAKRLLA